MLRWWIDLLVMIKSGRLLSAWNTTGVLPGLLFLPFRFQCFTGFEECGNVSRMTLCFIFILRRQVWIFSWLGLVSWGSLDANLVGTETRFLDMGEDVHSCMALTSNDKLRTVRNSDKIYSFEVVCDYVSLMFRRQRCDFGSNEVAFQFFESVVPVQEVAEDIPVTELDNSSSSRTPHGWMQTEAQREKRGIRRLQDSYSYVLHSP